MKKAFLFLIIFGAFLYVIKSFDEDRLESTFFFTLGSLLIYLGFKIKQEIDLILNKGIKTKAQVINFIKDEYTTSKGTKRIYYYPIIKFNKQEVINM